MSRLGILFLVAGGIMVHFSFHARGLDERASATPEEITLESLIQRGPGGNPHVAVKDFAMTSDYVQESEGNDRNRFKRVWLPVAPVKPGEPRGVVAPQGPIAAIVKSSDVSTPAEVLRFSESSSFKGMVINEIEQLSGEERKLLAESYPGTDFDRCLIIQHNRTPYSAQLRLWLLGGGVLALVAGCLLLVAGYAKHKPVFI